MAVKPPRGPDDLRPPAAEPSRPTKPSKAPPPATTPARLTHDANYYRARELRSDAPDFVDILDGAPSGGATLGDLLPSARSLGHPDLPEVDIRPPPFLAPLAAMKDVYMRVKGRASPKTTELLQSVDLEDLLDYLRQLLTSETLRAKPEARLVPRLYRELRDDPGPMLLGLNDPRLTEPWRVFLDGWDVWQPHGEEEGVELFWEGEAEDDNGQAIDVVQSLMYLKGELVLHTLLGVLEDRVAFDGQAFYRLPVRD